MIGIAGSSITLLTSFILNYVPYKQDSEFEKGDTRWRFMITYISCISLALYLMAVSLWEGWHPAALHEVGGTPSPPP